MTATTINLHAPYVLGAPPGRDGLQVSLRATDTHIQWRLGMGGWVDLIPLADISPSWSDWPAASQGEAEAGTDATKIMTPLATKQSIASEVGVSLATKAQGDLAATAVQPSEIGTAAAEDAGYFATAAQGSLADSALQPAAIGVTVQEYDANTAKLDADQLWTAPQRGSETALSVSAGAIAWDAASGNDFSVTLTANATLSFPTNAAAHSGQKGRILITQDATGGRTLATHADLVPLGSATTPSIPTVAESQAYFAYEIISSTLVVYSLTGVGA